MIEYAFPTPIYHNRVSDFNNIQSKITNSLSKIDFDYNSKWGKTHLISSNLSERELKRSGLQPLLKEIDVHLKEYCLQLNFILESYNMCGWFAKFGKDNSIIRTLNLSSSENNNILEIAHLKNASTEIIELC